MDTPDTETSSRQKAPKRVFFAAVVVIFFLTLSAADSIGFVPSYIDGSISEVALKDLPQLGLPAQAGESTGILPERIVIPSINLDLPIQNPATKDVELLDAALQKGPVRYMDSAQLGEKGNILVFAHSSHLPIVHNQMYRAFNNISDLKEGDSIIVSGEGKEYTYRVTSVRHADATEEMIDLSKAKGTRLTLSTCDTFGKKTARWVVEAELVGAPLVKA